MKRFVVFAIGFLLGIGVASVIIWRTNRPRLAGFEPVALTKDWALPEIHHSGCTSEGDRSCIALPNGGLACIDNQNIYLLDGSGHCPVDNKLLQQLRAAPVSMVALPSGGIAISTLLDDQPGIVVLHSDGTCAWQRALDDAAVFPGNATVLLAPAADGELLAVAARYAWLIDEKGKVKQLYPRQRMPNGLLCSAPLDRDALLLTREYLGDGTILVRLENASGAVHWSYSARDVRAAQLLPDGGALLGIAEAGLIRLDAAGHQVWTQAAQYPQFDGCSFVVTKHNLIAARWGKQLCFWRMDGQPAAKPVWLGQRARGYLPEMAGLIEGDDGNIYVQCSDWASYPRMRWNDLLCCSPDGGALWCSTLMNDNSNMLTANAAGELFMIRFGAQLSRNKGGGDYAVELVRLHVAP
jgi:hypothetical protein